MVFNKIIFYLVVIVFVFSISPDISSQTLSKEKKIYLGLDGGVQFTNIYDNWAYSVLPKRKLGFTIGIFADYKFTSNIKVRLGAYYDNRGFKIQDVISPISELQSDDSIYVSYPSYYESDLIYNLNYLTIPFSVFYEKDSKKFSVFIQAGVFYSLLLDAHKTGYTDLYIYPEHANNFEDERLRTPGNTITEFDKEDIYDMFVGNDWGIQLFIGFVYHINEKFDVQLTPGITLPFEHLYSNPRRNSKWNSIFKINAGIVYSLK